MSLMDGRPHNFRYNYGKPNYDLPYRGNDDANLVSPPIAPKNVTVTSPYLVGFLDIRWDNPSIYSENNGLSILGTNVYRAFDSPEAAYEKLNDTPIGILFYRDQTKEIQIVDEDPVVGGRLIAGTNATGDWVVRTYFKPIIIPGTNGRNADNPKQVTVRIKKTASDSFVAVPAFKVNGYTGEIFLISNRIYNNTTNRLEQPTLPDLNLGGEIRVSYNYINNLVQTDIYRKIYYKVTTVAVNQQSQLIESPLSQVEPFSPYEMEKVDWVWAEAIRRNKWLLEQAGERAKVFLRKWAGERCSCWNDEYRQATEDCRSCYGTGYIGGYEGPYDILLAPPETEKLINLTDIGLHVSYDWTTWSGPYPLLTDRDFVVRQNNDRCSIAHINPQGSRGAIYQQHFVLGHLDQRDIRYQVSIYGGQSSVPPEWNAYRTDRPTDASPTIPTEDSCETPEQYQFKGRTVTFENIVT